MPGGTKHGQVFILIEVLVFEDLCADTCVHRILCWWVLWPFDVSLVPHCATRVLFNRTPPVYKKRKMDVLQRAALPRSLDVIEL